MNATQPTLLNLDEQMRPLTPQPPADDGTIQWAMRYKRCYVHRDRPGQPHDGDTVPYCDECRKEHERRWRHLN